MLYPCGFGGFVKRCKLATRVLLFIGLSVGRSKFDKIISNRARLRLVACVMVHKAAKNAA